MVAVKEEDASLLICFEADVRGGQKGLRGLGGFGGRGGLGGEWLATLSIGFIIHLRSILFY